MIMMHKLNFQGDIQMAAIDLFTAPGQPGIDPARQKALLVACLLLSSNSLLTYAQTRIVTTDAEVAQAQTDGARHGSLINYLDMRDVYPKLAPLTPQEVDDLFAVARSAPEFASVASSYWQQGESMLGYDDHYCLAVAKVLSLND